VLDDPAETGIGTEEVLPGIGARLGGVLLELAVGGGVHLVEKDAVDVTGQQLVPLRAPDDLDHVPAGAPEGGLGLLDDLPVAPDGSVEALQVAVDDEGQVVEMLATGDREAPVESTSSSSPSPTKHQTREADVSAISRCRR